MWKQPQALELPASGSAILTMITIVIEVAVLPAATVTPPEPPIRATTIEITFLIIIFTGIFIVILILIEITILKIISVVILFLI